MRMDRFYTLQHMILSLSMSSYLEYEYDRIIVRMSRRGLSLSRQNITFSEREKNLSGVIFRNSRFELHISVAPKKNGTWEWFPREFFWESLLTSIPIVPYILQGDIEGYYVRVDTIRTHKEREAADKTTEAADKDTDTTADTTADTAKESTGGRRRRRKRNAPSSLRSVDSPEAKVLRGEEFTPSADIIEAEKKAVSIEDCIDWDGPIVPVPHLGGEFILTPAAAYKLAKKCTRGVAEFIRRNDLSPNGDSLQSLYEKGLYLGGKIQNILEALKGFVLPSGEKLPAWPDWDKLFPLLYNGGEFNFTHEAWTSLSYEEQVRYASSWQQLWADMKGLPKYIHKDWGATFVLCPPGWMTLDGLIETRMRRVKAFYMSKTPVTQKQWSLVMGEQLPLTRDFHYPLVYQEYDRIEEFCELAECSLPTSTQWEYACRAGTTTLYNLGETITTDIVNCLPHDDGSKEIERGGPNRVGELPANAWGIHDFHGNVWELIEDGNWIRVAGGSFASPPEGCTSSSFRRDFLPREQVGFRVIIPIPE